MFDKIASPRQKPQNPKPSSKASAFHDTSFQTNFFEEVAPKPKSDKLDDAELALMGWRSRYGLLRRDPGPLKPRGVCRSGAAYEYLSGKEGIAQLIALLNGIAESRSPFALDYETGPRMLAPVDPATGRFDLAKLSHAVGKDPKHTGSEPHTSTVFLLAVSVKEGHSHVADAREALALGARTSSGPSATPASSGG